MDMLPPPPIAFEAPLVDTVYRPALAYPETMRKEWQAAALQYEDAIQATANAIEDGLIAPPSSLMDYVHDELASALRPLGVVDSPDTLHARLVVPPTTWLAHATTLVTQPDTLVVTLPQLAMQNVGRDTSDGPAVLDAAGNTHSVLKPSHLRGLVRELDVGRRYLEHVEETLGDSPMGLLNREYANTLWLARMRFDAAEARLRHADQRLPHGFIPDARERAFHWVHAILAHPSARGRRPVEGVDLHVQQLVYRGSAVVDVLLIGARHDRESRHVVLYTPDAPDGLAFREFRDRQALLEGFLVDRRFESYLLRRLPARFATLDVHGLPRFEVSYTSRTVQWTFGGTECGFCTVLEEPFTYRDVAGNVADAAYDAAIAQTEDDTAYFTRTTAQADTEDTDRKIRLVHSQTNMLGGLVADLGMATLYSIPQMAQASWRFYDEVKAGNTKGAFLHAVDGYTAALNVLPFYAAAPRTLLTRRRPTTSPSRTT